MGLGDHKRTNSAVSASGIAGSRALVGARYRSRWWVIFAVVGSGSGVFEDDLQNRHRRRLRRRAGRG